MSHPGWFDADSKQEVKAIHTTTNIANDLYFICRKFRSILPPPPFLSLPQSRFHAIICPNMVQARLLTGNPLPLQNINRCERVVNALRITITQYLLIARSQTDDAVMKVSGGGPKRGVSHIPDPYGITYSNSSLIFRECFFRTLSCGLTENRSEKKKMRNDEAQADRKFCRNQRGGDVVLYGLPV